MKEIVASIKNMTIKMKLIVLFIAVGIMPLVIVAILAYAQSASALDAKTYAGLGSIAEYKTRVLEDWIHDRMTDDPLAGDMMTKEEVSG